MRPIGNNSGTTNPRGAQFLGVTTSDPKRDAILATILRLPSLATPPICLPDIHLKHRTEGPCSFAAATTNTIVPDLTAPSVGCGMGIVATSLTEPDLTPESLRAFYHEMKSHLGPRYGKLKNMLLWFGLIHRPHLRYDLTIAEFEALVSKGAPAAIRRYQLPRETLQHIDHGGEYTMPEDWKGFALRDVLPRISYRSGRHDIGYGFKGNHFLELQIVDTIMDEEAARTWGLTQGQVVVMYHGGGGAVSYHVGRYFGNRKKNNFLQKCVLFLFKAHFHFRLRALRDWPMRARSYFFPRPFMEHSLATREGRRLWLATQVSQNYSVGFRMGIFARITDSMKTVFGSSTTCRLVWDAPHNVIVKEKLPIGERVVHRHTANPAHEGLPVMLSGFNTTHSLLGVGGNGAQDFLYSSDHGAGETIHRARKDGRSHLLIPERTTRIIQTREPKERTVAHESDEGLDDVVRPLNDAHIMAPVATFRPIAVFKG